MGQYFVVVNLDKEEYLHPHQAESGMKLWEVCNNRIAGLLVFLLRQSSEVGGGDICKYYKYAGRWACDRIVVVGDYDSSELYHTAFQRYRNITGEAYEDFCDFVMHRRGSRGVKHPPSVLMFEMM